MTSLLDTCVILWAARDQDQLSACVRGLLLDSRQALVVSVVSAWELGISDAAGWLRRAARNLQATILPVRLDHIAALQTLPLRHRDPFDRLLMAQAVAGEFALVTADEVIRNYSEVHCV